MLNRKTKSHIIKASLALLAIAPIIIYAHEYGPDPGYTGAPGDNATGCTASGCHTGTPNASSGSIKIVASGGNTYTPGVKQQIQVTITDSAQKKYGFQLTSRADSSPKTVEAGILSSTDANTQVLCADGSNQPANGGCKVGSNTLEWIEHTLAAYDSKANASPGFTYTFNWTPPATAIGTITLYAAGNAANGDLTPNGDHTYLTSFKLSPAAAVPAPAITAVVNGASFAPGAPIEAGSWVTIFGTNLAPASSNRKWNESTEIVNGKLPTSLDGTSVTVNGKPAVVEFVYPTQINIQPPDDDSIGPVQVVLTTTAGGASNSFTANLAGFSPGFFPAAAPYLAAQHADNSYVTPTSPAKPGEVIILWGTGFGPGQPPVSAGQVVSSGSPTANAVTMTIGGLPAPVDFAGIVGAGLVQINVHVPASIGNIDAAVVATVGGVQSQSTANLIPVHN